MKKSLPIQLYETLRSEFEHSSKNLRKFAGKRDYLKDYNRILKADDILYIGYIDDIGLLCGNRLLQVACANFDTFSYTGIKQVEDVTEWFIKEYKEKGMCAYNDWRHEWDKNEIDSKLPDGAVRKCLHCGKVETLHSKMVRKTWWS